MSKVRKPNNGYARAERNCRALVRTNHVSVVNLEPGDRQWMIHWKSGKLIRSGFIVDALVHVAHRWTIFAASLCEKPDGERYMKSSEFTTDTVYLVAALEELIQETLDHLVANSNPGHLKSRAWIAIPDNVTLTEAQASGLFNVVNGWEAWASAA